MKSKIKTLAATLSVVITLASTNSSAKEFFTDVPFRDQNATSNDIQESEIFYENPDPLQLTKLSAQDMRDSQGAWWNYAVGGLAGGIYGGIGYYNTPNRTTVGWATAVGSGVVGGVVGAANWWSAPIWGGGIATVGGWTATRLY